ncbi:MAG: Nif11-like leader peptide family RiPP precursor [Oscillospiraceae bacterium]|nr:Nif11-like leader peptide family RiPP precursor [Oscillospiraceae bacterium]
MKSEFTPELMKKARQANSIAELLSLAKENGIALTQDEAENYFAQLHQSVELSDEELDQVAGGTDVIWDTRPARPFDELVRPGEMKEFIVHALTPEQEKAIDMMNNLLHNSSSLDLNSNLEFDSSLINMDYLN